MDMFYQDEGGGLNSLVDSTVVAPSAPRTSLTYEEVVRELMASERQYLRDLHMIIRVFRYVHRAYRMCVCLLLRSTCFVLW